MATSSTLEATRERSEIESLSAEILERYEEVSLVYRLSERLGAVLGQRAVARLVIDEASQVLQARGGELWLRENYEAVRLVHTGVVPPPLQAADRALADALEKGRVTMDEPSGNEKAKLVVPLPNATGKPIGAIVLRGRTDDRPFRTGDQKLLLALATLTSAFLRNHRLAESAREADLRRRDAEIAKQIHRSLLPDREVDYPGLQTSGASFSAEKIGGDCYDYLRLADGSLGIFVADVAGHGVAAALYMAAAKGAIHAEATRTSDPAELLSRTNAVLAERFERTELYATAFLLRVAPGGREWSYAGAGHPAALRFRGDGRLEALDSCGTALGMFPDVEYRTETRTFDPADRLIVYTDGLVEARSSAGEMYGLERLIKVARQQLESSARDLRHAVLDDLEQFSDRRGVADDVTLVVAHPHGEMP